MRVGISLPEPLVDFADQEARRRGTSRSGLLAQLLEAERVRRQVSEYIDLHGWDVCEDESSWREYQRRRFAEDSGGDEW